MNIWNRISALTERKKTTWMAGMTVHRSQMGTSIFMEGYVNIWNRMSTLMEREKTTWMAGMTLHPRSISSNYQ